MYVELLEALQTIIELEEQRRKIRKKAADENVEKELGRAQRQARKTGDNAPVREIMEREYERAKAAAATLQKAFADAESAANADGVLTDAEKAKLQDLKNELRATLDDAERWSDRIEDHDRNDKRTSRAVGSFSAAILEGLLGGNKPEEETAKNTKELVRLIREQQDDDDDDTLTFE